MFESGAIAHGGPIEGNDNDVDAATFEPHYTEIRQPDQVQIYEPIMGDSAGRPTTGLLTAVAISRTTACCPAASTRRRRTTWVKVTGGAVEDADFTGGGDRVRYSVDVGGATGPFHVDVELQFQPIGYRWAHNLGSYDAIETRRFVDYYHAMSVGASEIVATATAETTLVAAHDPMP